MAKGMDGVGRKRVKACGPLTLQRVKPFLSCSFVILRQNALEIFVFIQRVLAFPYDSVFLSRL